MKPNAQRARIVIAFLWIGLAVDLISGISDYFQLRLLHDASNGLGITQERIDSNDMRQILIALLMTLITLGIAITFIMWFRRGYYNLHRVMKNLSFSEGWAAGAWFVPFVNLGRPYRIMKEMAYETQELLIKANLTEEKTIRTRIVGVWWTLWIISSLVTNTVSRIQLRNDSLDALINTTTASIVLAIFSIPLTIVTVRMIKEYAEMETLLPQLNQAEGRPIVLNDSDILDSI